MRRNRIVLQISCLLIATMLGWFLRGVFEDFTNNAGRSTSKVIQNPGKSDSSHFRTPQAFASHDGSSGLAVGAFRRQRFNSGGEVAQGSSQPAAALPPTLIPQDLGPGEIEIDPATGALHFTPVDPETTHMPPPPSALKPKAARSAAIEMDPVTGAVRFVRSSTGEAQSPTHSIEKTPDANKTKDSPAAPITGK
jgi:hypothetical protein